MPASPSAITSLDLGGITLTYVPDGEFRAEPGLAYPRGSDAMLSDGLDVVDDDGMLVLSVGAILISTGGRRVLVDTGIGRRTIPLVRPGTTRDAYMRGGALLDNLRAVDVGPEDVDAVLLTHLHADHVGWIGDEDTPGVHTFPNAEYWLDESEWAFWNRPEHSGDAVAPRPNELALIDERRRPLTSGSGPVAGVTAVPTTGHTPGHHAFAVQGTHSRALIVGDAVHCPGEVLHPDVVWVGDHDADGAVRTRHEIADRVGSDDVVLVGPHFPDAVFRRFDPDAAQPVTAVAHQSTERRGVAPGR
ncbi:MBL fold metallo-hydrolase [Curtobacterium sp. L1-20]|uniref:MBL fold metallo-hydrolase n=1 Tax=Curtobacterium sp. L1-20 TaxID=3138181 RepID=UPI003B52A888